MRMEIVAKINLEHTNVGFLENVSVGAIEKRKKLKTLRKIT